MKRFTASVTILTFLLLTSYVRFGFATPSNIPDPDESDCGIWDINGCVFVSPGQESHIDQVTITVRNADGDPIEGSVVEVIFTECTVLICEPSGLTGITGEDGTVTLNPSLGGCDEIDSPVLGDCTVVVRADNVTISAYTRVASTDWDGAQADAAVTGADFAFFAVAFKLTQDPCADYNCDGVVSGTDFTLFAIAFSLADHCLP